MSKLESHRTGRVPLPAQYRAWQVFGAGLENVGRDGKPVTLELRPPADNEVLLRVDALGLCLSDMKIIAQGGNHPRLRGRDLATDPTVLGHECAATVVKVGRQWQDTFKPGDRYIVQADIYYKGVGFAFGYMIPGGLAEYTYLDERALAGDEGCYLLPVRPETGYSQSALAEPWACVEMSYCLEERLEPHGDAPLVVVESLDESCLARFPQAVHLRHDLAGLDALGDRVFADIIVRHPTPEIVNALAKRLNKNGNLWLVGKPGAAGPVTLDVGGIHYENKRFFGGGENLAEVAEANRRNDLLPGGRALFIGAGGPMGQMHVQRAIEKTDGPALAVVTDLDRGRLDHIVHRFGGLAQTRGIDLVTLAATEFAAPQAMNDCIRELAPGGYNDIVVLAPVPALVEQAVTMAADNAFVNLFAGLGIGTPAKIPLEALCRGVKLIGCSGSRIRDLRKVLQLVEGGELDTNRSVAAIGGLDAAHDGLQAVKDARFPGKTVIYTQIPTFPLTPLEKLADALPEVAAKLSPEGAWTKEAEEALLEHYLP
ncbi:MAG TPA: alcohol dehydrogenase catalytic domain-containing protein [Candidatus Hydrogenedentes bacterium]|nr:alcohol dehydrogenase catalytic domain-containing protein [Candidatus Hydrogenedentota bacterium]